jgi:hypothetical protein
LDTPLETSTKIALPARIRGVLHHFLAVADNILEACFARRLVSFPTAVSATARIAALFDRSLSGGGSSTTYRYTPTRLLRQSASPPGAEFYGKVRYLFCGVNTTDCANRNIFPCLLNDASAGIQSILTQHTRKLPVGESDAHQFLWIGKYNNLFGVSSRAITVSDSISA